MFRTSRWRDVEQPAVADVVVGHEQAGAEVRLVEDSVEIAFDAGGSGWKNSAEPHVPVAPFGGWRPLMFSALQSDGGRHAAVALAAGTAFSRRPDDARCIRLRGERTDDGSRANAR